MTPEALVAEPTKHPRSAVALLIGLCALSFVASLVIVSQVFPLYSLNHDDSVYVYSARMLADGNLTLSADEHEFFRPWASGVRDDRIVLKYSPAWPAVLAAAKATTGSFRIALGVTTAATVLLMYALAVELFRRPWVGVVAAAAFASSPIVLLQSGTYLPYLFQLAAGLAFATLLLSGIRREKRVRLAAAGLALGIAAFARPFDAFLFALPFVLVVLIAGRRDLRSLVRKGTWVLAGAGPVLLAQLVYNAQVMGSPVRLPFSITGPQDTLGFGVRGVFPEATIPFSAANGLSGLTRNLAYLPSWTFGGLLFLALAAAGIVLARRTGDARRWSVLGLAVSFPLGYLFFWSPYAMSHLWQGVQTFGPFYHLPVVVPLVLFGAYGLVDLWRHPRYRAVGVGVAVTLVAVTATSYGPKIAANDRVTDEHRMIAAQVDALDLDNAILFLPRRGNQGYRDPAPFLENRPDLRQPVLYADDRGAANIELIERYPDRRPFRLSQEVDLDGTLLARVSAAPLQVETGDDFVLNATIVNPGDKRRVVAYVTDGDQTSEQALDASSSRGREYHVSWHLGAPGESGTNQVSLVPHRPSGEVTLGVRFLDGPEPVRQVDRWERRLPLPGGGWADDVGASGSRVVAVNRSREARVERRRREPGDRRSRLGLGEPVRTSPPPAPQTPQPER